MIYFQDGRVKTVHQINSYTEAGFHLHFRPPDLGHQSDPRTAVRRRQDGGGSSALQVTGRRPPQGKQPAPAHFELVSRDPYALLRLAQLFEWLCAEEAETLTSDATSPCLQRLLQFARTVPGDELHLVLLCILYICYILCLFKNIIIRALCVFPMHIKLRFFSFCLRKDNKKILNLVCVVI